MKVFTVLLISLFLINSANAKSEVWHCDMNQDQKYEGGTDEGKDMIVKLDLDTPMIYSRWPGKWTKVFSDDRFPKYKYNKEQDNLTITTHNSSTKESGKFIFDFLTKTLVSEGINVVNGESEKFKFTFLCKEYIDSQTTTADNRGSSEQRNPDEVVPAASGSGFIVSSSGHIVTNNHVVEGCNDVKVHQKGKVFKATIIEVDHINDLAVIKADISPSIVFSISDKDAALMQDIYVAGYPFGASISSSIKVTKGIVSSLSGIGNNYSNMQIDAALQPGNSGGPILDEKGNVVGVAVAKLDLSLMLKEFGTIPEDTNFGIKSSILKTFLRANSINTKNRSDKNISRSELGQKITDGTLFLSCWMTYAKIEELRTKKVMFENLK